MLELELMQPNTAQSTKTLNPALTMVVWVVSHCRLLSPDKTEWRLISATLCGRRRCFVADQLWLMTRIREEEEDYINCVMIHTCIVANVAVW